MKNEKPMPQGRSIALAAQGQGEVADERDDFESEVSLAYHRLLAEVQGVLHASMEECGCSQTDLARVLKVTKGTVSRYLEDDANLTLRTIARVSTALGDRFQVSTRRFNCMVAEGTVGRLYKPDPISEIKYNVSVGPTPYRGMEHLYVSIAVGAADAPQPVLVHGFRECEAEKIPVEGNA